MVKYDCQAQMRQMTMKKQLTNNNLLSESFYNFGEKEVLSVKIGAKVVDLWLDMFFGPKWPKCSFYAPDPKIKKFFEIS